MLYSNKSVLLTSTYEFMYKHIIQSIVSSQTTHNSTHIYTFTTKHTIANATMSTKSTHNALQTSIVKVRHALTQKTINLVACSYSKVENYIPVAVARWCSG